VELNYLPDLIKRIRNVSSNPSVFVMIGGRAINERNDLTNRFGADVCATDAANAVELARELLATTT
jgi:methanogenic corrinoid protein MtbC1